LELPVHKAAIPDRIRPQVMLSIISQRRPRLQKSQSHLRPYTQFGSSVRELLISTCLHTQKPLKTGASILETKFLRLSVLAEQSKPFHPKYFSTAGHGNALCFVEASSNSCRCWKHSQPAKNRFLSDKR